MVNHANYQSKLKSIYPPDISNPGTDSIEKYLHYRNLRDRFWLKKDNLFMEYFGNQFWDYKFGAVLNHHDNNG